METLKDILWPIVLVGGVGAFIDFLIGKAGQERAKEFLFRWWVRFNDVQWRSFGREEGFFAGELIGRWCGRRIWSFRRFMAAVTILSFLLCVGYIRFLTSSWEMKYLCNYCSPPFDEGLVTVIVYFISFSLSVSFTKFIAVRMAYLCGNGRVRNLLIFLSMLIITYLTLMMTQPITESLKEPIITAIRYALMSSPTFEDIPSYLLVGMKDVASDLSVGIETGKDQVLHPTELFKITYNIDIFALHFLSLLPSLARFALAIIFVGSVLLRPLIIGPVSLVWARIVESEKPVFTVIFGGVAAFASAIREAAKHL